MVGVDGIARLLLA